MASGATQDAVEPSGLGQAHTSIQLLQQLTRDGYSGDGLDLIRGALALASRLFACRFQHSGEPFMVHVIGSASFLSSLRMAPELVAAGLLHNVYGNGDFGDARGGVADWKREIVRGAVGSEAEQYVYGFSRSLRWSPETISRFSLDVDSLEASDRAVLLLRLADLAEHHRDLGMVFNGRQRQQRQMLEQLGGVWLQLAEILAGPAFAAALNRLFEATTSTELPDEICGFTGRRGSFPLLPRSHRPRLSVALRQTAGRIRDFAGRVLARLRRQRSGRMQR
jgi:(p)ppGpp synthase/HD superfamily hydrolase